MSDFERPIADLTARFADSLAPEDVDDAFVDSQRQLAEALAVF